MPWLELSTEDTEETVISQVSSLHVLEFRGKQLENEGPC